MVMLNKDELKLLSKQRSETCISIYIPTHRMGKETEQDPIRLKNLLRDVSAKLEKQGRRSNEIEELILPARKLLDSREFWNHQSDGLAVFLSVNESHIYRLPLTFNEMAIISNRFHIKQLLPLFTDDGRFLVLALNLNNLRLFEASRYNLSELELKNVPTKIEDVLKYDDREEQIQYHTGMRDISGRRRSIYHGHGGLDESVRKKNASRYIDAAEKGISKLIASRQEPLILVGLESNLSMYRDTNSYHNLLKETVTANPDDLNTEELHRLAWKAAEQYFEGRKKQALEKYNDQLGTGLASNDLEEIVKAAHARRVEYLFLKKGERVLGTFDPAGNKLYISEKDEERGEDLLDFAAVQTILSDGVVYIIDPDGMPGENPAAAVYRY